MKNNRSVTIQKHNQWEDMNDEEKWEQMRYGMQYVFRILGLGT